MPPHAAPFFPRIPFDMLAAIDSRALHYALQPVHHLIRLVHILAMAAFFGAILLLDLRLMGAMRAITFRPFAERLLPALYASFAIACVTGAALFLYDPVAVGSHAYFAPKLALIALGLLNAALFHRKYYAAALTAAGRLPRMAFLAGGLSLVLWTGVVACASLNVEAAPKVRLR